MKSLASLLTTEGLSNCCLRLNSFYDTSLFKFSFEFLQRFLDVLAFFYRVLQSCFLFLIIMYEYYFCVKCGAKLNNVFESDKENTFFYDTNPKKVHIRLRYAPSKPYWHQPITDSD